MKTKINNILLDYIQNLDQRNSVKIPIQDNWKKQSWIIPIKIIDKEKELREEVNYLLSEIHHLKNILSLNWIDYENKNKNHIQKNNIWTWLCAS